MLIYLYEAVVNENALRTPGRLIGEIRCKGDGTPGELIYYDTCDEIMDIKDVNHRAYGKNCKIFNEMNRKRLKFLLNRSLFVTTGGGLDKDGVHTMEGGNLLPWKRETLEYILRYEFPAGYGTICGKIAED